MKDTRAEHAEKVALFRYGLIADLLQPAPGDGRKLYERLKEKASRLELNPTPAAKKWLTAVSLTDAQKAAIGMAQELLGEPFETIESTVNGWTKALETMSP